MKSAITLLFVAMMSAQAIASDTLTQLSASDRDILETGKISDAAHISGAAIGTLAWAAPLLVGGGPQAAAVGLAFPTFGLGHVAQRRYLETGWIFTLAESATIAMMIPGANCIDGCHGPRPALESGALMVGFFGYLMTRGWELADLWFTPVARNRRYDELKSRQSSVAIAPILSARTAGAGLQFTF